MSQEGFEPSTPALKGRYSTAELLARNTNIDYKNNKPRGEKQEICKIIATATTATNPARRETP